MAIFFDEKNLFEKLSNMQEEQREQYVKW